ncbi:hypothetical protein [Fulvivirga sp. M361]|nr:hypothetical protein [Fulvivirga sp. M361]
MKNINWQETERKRKALSNSLFIISLVITGLILLIIYLSFVI